MASDMEEAKARAHLVVENTAPCNRQAKWTKNLSKISPHQVPGNKMAEHVSECDRIGAPIQSVEATVRQPNYFNNSKKNARNKQRWRGKPTD